MHVNPRVDRDLAKKTDSAVRVDFQVPPRVRALDMIMDYQAQCIALEVFEWAVLDNSDQ
jgi:nucleosome binding factor SPN SPT16 subunit